MFLINPFPINPPPYQPTISTHFINPPSQPILFSTLSTPSMTLPIIQPINVDDGLFKPVLAGMGKGADNGLDMDNIASLGGNIDNGGTAATAGGQGPGALDPRLWLQKRVITAAAGGDDRNSPPTTAAVGDDTATSTPPTTTEEEFLQMYYMDALEISGVIYLFGKIALLDSSSPTTTASSKSGGSTGPKYTSCCVAIHGSERNLYVLPRAIPGQFHPDGTQVRSGLADVFRDINHLLVPDIIPKQQGKVSHS